MIEDPRAMRVGRILWDLLNPAVDPDRLEALGWQRAFGHRMLGELLREGWEPPARFDGSESEAEASWRALSLDERRRRAQRHIDGYGERIGHSQECVRADPGTPCLCEQSDGTDAHE